MLVETRTLKVISSIMKDELINPSEIMNTLISENILIKTDDGTYSLRSEKKDELMHSTMGAMSEAFEKFAIPSGINELEKPILLDLCSGLGYNSLAALIHNKDVSIDMVEISKEIIFISQFLSLNYEEHAILKKAVSDYFLSNDNAKINIFCSDARKMMKNKPFSNYDVVFHDGFSPANDPVLYTVEFLKLLYHHMNDNAVLLSYSSSIPFRSSLIEAGFYIGEGPAVGRKRGITIAAKDEYDKRLTKRLPSSDELLISLSTIGIPFHDKNLSGTTDLILKEREIKRNFLKEKKIYLSTKQIKKRNIDKHYFHIMESATNSRDAVIALKTYHKRNR